jgi:polyisoprenoid-binding protein YceI
MTSTKWVADPAHSEIYFKVKHLMITTVTGYFREFEATAQTQDNDFSNADVYFAAKTASIDTNAADRDKHLRSGDFFESDKYPEMVFRSTGIEIKDDDNYTLHGDLTIRDVTRPVSLDVEYGGMMKDPYGSEKAGFSISGRINRKDWNLNWNAALETGGVLVSDEVRLFCEIQMVKTS